MNRRLEYGAGLRRADDGALQLVLGGHFALDEFAHLGFDISQILADLAAEIAVDLDDLQPRFRDLAMRLRHRCDQLCAFAIDPCRFPLELGQAGERHKILGVEVDVYKRQRLANEAGAKQLCLFHHDPSHDDEFMDSLAADANDARPGTITAREGQIIDL